MGRVVLEHGQLVLPNRVVTGDLVMEDGVIAAIAPHADTRVGETRIDARGKLVFPGLIDSQVRFRAYTRHGDEDLHSGTMAAARGGVTSVLEVPDAHPDEAHDRKTLANKLALARDTAVVHYGFWLRATADGLEEALKCDGVVGARLRLDCSESQRPVAERWFAAWPHVLAVHAEDRSHLAARYAMYADDPDVTLHHRIRDVETAIRGTRLALDLAARHGTRLHLLNVSSAEEIDLLRGIENPRVTVGVALPHLVLTSDDAATLGTRMQCNPPVRTPRHQDALWQGLRDGTVHVVCSDHCPHGLTAKRVPYPDSASGLPGVEWTLPWLLTTRSARGHSLCDVARWGADAPARAFGLARKGRLEVGFDADVVLVDPQLTRKVTDAAAVTAAGWSPYVGRQLTGWPTDVWVAGQAVLHEGMLQPRVRGRALNPRSRSPT